EPQADGDVSETESNCSAVSGFQTPLFVRVTRRRQIVVPCQPGSPEKKRHDKTPFPNKLSRILDEGDVSEAESCSSAVSGVQMSNDTRPTRSRQSKKKLQQERVCEAQSEDKQHDSASEISSHMEPSVTTNQTTRRAQMKLQAENTKQTEKGNRIVSEDEHLIEPGITSESRSAADLVSDAEGTSVTENNKEYSSAKSKCSLKSASTSWNEEEKNEILNDVTLNSLPKMHQSIPESPGKQSIENTHSAGVDGLEEVCDQIQEEHSRIIVREGKLEHMDLSLIDYMSPKQSSKSQGQIAPNKGKKNKQCRRADAETNAQQSFIHAAKLKKGKQTSAVSSPQRDIIVAQRTDSTGGCRTLEIALDSDEDRKGECAESLSHSSERSSSGNNSVALFLSKDESDESKNSEAADTDTVEDSLCYKEADERAPSLKKSLKNSSLHAEGLFVIDTEPGMSSSQTYYLDQVDQHSDAESKPEESEKGEESSDLEESGEELIDEDEKDEDNDLLENKIDVLHLSSSIDPGLNMKKLGGLYISFDAENQNPRSSVIKQLKEKKKDQLLQKSIITPDFEKKECVPPFRESLRQLKKQRRAEREKTTGDGWFGMKAPEITSELKNDLKVLKMRASLDPKHFYKKNDRDGLPKYFQVGTVVDSPIDFYHSRIPKKQRKRTIVEELLADSEFRRYNKKKYQEIMSEKAAFAAGKRNRKKRKFHN
ncbi:TDIF2 protein, partial [Galbula dea]|nr:TDIF2 protein [Galbula dea]